MDINLSSLSEDELNSLINNAKRELQHRKSARVTELRREIERMASSLGISVGELMGLEKSARRSTAASTKGMPKFANPANPSQTWTGRGKPPRWYSDAIDGGAHKEDLMIK
ncbi:MAG: H-NS histone family protein [Halothiobacillaceae bacterium]|nr:H-NS histone family protein [Halothiobacillaceae bacterium]